MVRRKTADLVGAFSWAPPQWSKARLSDPEGGEDNVNSNQPNRLMTGTEFPNRTRPHGSGVPAHHPNAH
jgi:hypothetical protein